MSVLVILVLIVVNLGAGAFPAVHPEWSSGLVWALALVGGVLFLGSILLHELAHALVAKGFGVPVGSITLFLFGGISDIERAPPSPKIELAVAAVGPLTSLALGMACSVVAVQMSGRSVSDDPVRVAAAMGPLATLLAWLGPINLLLGSSTSSQGSRSMGVGCCGPRSGPAPETSFGPLAGPPASGGRSPGR